MIILDSLSMLFSSMIRKAMIIDVGQLTKVYIIREQINAAPNSLQLLAVLPDQEHLIFPDWVG